MLRVACARVLTRLTCTQLLRRDFSISMINVEPAESGGDMSDMRIKIPEWDFILGWGAFGSPTDHVMRHLHENGHKSPRGLCIGGNAVRAPACIIYHCLCTSM